LLWFFCAVGLLQGAGGTGQLFCRSAPPPTSEAAIWVTENPRGSSPDQPNLEVLSENVVRSFHSLAKLVLAFLGCGGSCRGLVVLGSCSVGVQHPPMAGASSWAIANPRGFSPGHSNSERLSENVGRFFHSPAMLALAFLGCRPFPGGRMYLVLLCGCVAPPKGKQARAVTAPAVVGFQQLLRPALPDQAAPVPAHA